MALFYRLSLPRASPLLTALGVAVACTLALFLLLKPAQAAAPILQPGRPFGTGVDATTAVVAGDLDGDGDLDLAVGNYQQHSMVYLNDGRGNIADRRPFGSASAATVSIAVGDLDGDGDLDLAVGNASQPSIVYLNDGQANFRDGRLFGADSGNVTSLAVGDLDGDGDLDLVAGNNGDQSRVYINDGAGAFSSGPLFGAGMESTQRVAVGDLNNDGHLDIVTGNLAQPNAIYLNDSHGRFDWAGSQRLFGDDSYTRDVMLADLDADDDLDLIMVGNDGKNFTYLNDGAGNITSGVLIPGELTYAWSVAAGDLDADGDLDMVLGNYPQPDRVYLNNGGGGFTPGPIFNSGSDLTTSVAIADLDGDGALDIIGGNMRLPNAIYRNESAGSFPVERRFGAEASGVASVALGDIDNDGDLDLITGAYARQNVVYLNDGAGGFAASAVLCSAAAQIRCFGTGADNTTSVAVGDINGDGALDIAVGNDGEQSAIYLNNGSGVFAARRAFGPADAPTRSVVFGDLNGDGALDLVVGNYGQASMVYLNDGAGHVAAGRPFGDDSGSAWSVAPGDVDGDGDLDVIAGNRQGRSMLYLNDGAGNLAAGRPAGDANLNTVSVALRDIDGDGDLDLITGNAGQQSTLYLNDGQGSFGAGQPFGNGLYQTRSLAVGDVNGDGALDLVTGNYGQSNRVHLNDGRGAFLSGRSFSPGDDATKGVAVGDLDGDGDDDIVAVNEIEQHGIYLNQLAGADRLANMPPHITLRQPGPTPAADFFSSPLIHSQQIIPITYTLADRDGDPVHVIRAFYSLDGGGHWRPAQATSATPTTRLATGKTTGHVHTFYWDTFASGFFGQSDQVVIRIEAYPDPRTTGPYHRPPLAAQSFPFRVRGAQVRVVSDAQPEGVASALVYRLPKGQVRGAQPMTGNTPQPLRTNHLGYLQGRDALAPGDQLVALAPITATATYTVYHTSARPTASGLDMYQLTAPGVQALRVAPTSALVLLNLHIALEWDARNDPRFMAQLHFDLQRASDALYDWTNGQVALGQLTIHHNKAYWNDADIRIYATNRMRPNAALGGIGTEVITDPLSLARHDPVTKTLTYEPGQIRIGAVWNRFSRPDSNLSADWPRALAHELGHYALYLNDNYLGLDGDGLLTPVENCPGAMSDPYRNDFYSEFHPDRNWAAECATTMSHYETGRSDWRTITTFYPWLQAPATAITDSSIAGPSGMPLALPQIRVSAPLSASTVLDVPIFYLTEAGSRVQPGSKARAFLFQDTGPDLEVDRLIDLGHPNQDVVHARGARPGDRLCVYDLEARRLGCTTVNASSDQLVLVQTDWHPGVIVTPVTSTTITVDVARVAAGLSLKARLFSNDYPAHGSAASTPECLALPVITLAESAGGTYTGTFNGLADPMLDGYVYVWAETAGAPDALREVVTDFAIGGTPGRGKLGGGRGKLGGGRGKLGGAPLISADGQVTLFGDHLVFSSGAFYTLQGVTRLPAPPAWVTVVGQGYRLTASANAPAFQDTSISFSYLEGDVPSGQEHGLRIFDWDGATWQPLETRLNTDNNIASARTRGAGIYALTTGIEIPLRATGLNLVFYPANQAQPVAEALGSIAGLYTIVYGYDPADTRDPWKVYDVNAPGWVNDLRELTPGRAYWIHVTQPVTVTFKGGGTTPAAGWPPYPPATYYGAVRGDARFAPHPGMAVSARVRDQECGQGQTHLIDGQVVYVVDVRASDPGMPGCGATGQLVTFNIDSRVMAPTTRWNNTRVQELPLSLPIVYMPSVHR